MSSPIRTMGYPGLALQTGLSVRTLRHLVSRDEIPHVRYSKGIVRFDPSEIEAWVASKRRGVRAAA